MPDAVRAQPKLIEPLVEEVARFDSPVQNTRRFIAEHTVVAGVELKAGEAMLLCLAAANRDPQLNPQPDAFDLHRANRQYLTFGRGRHAYPGQALACTIAAAAINELLEAGLTPQHLSRGWTYRASLNAHIPICSA